MVKDNFFFKDYSFKTNFEKVISIIDKKKKKNYIYLSMLFKS